MWVESSPDVKYHEYEVYYNSDDSFHMTDYHSHDFYEFHLFISGTATTYIEEFSHDLKRGDLHAIPPGRLHRVERTDKTQTYERAFVYVSKEQIDAMSTNGFPMAAILERVLPRHQYLLHLPPDLFEPFLRFLRTTTFNQDAKPCEHIINRSTLTILLAQLCRLAEDIRVQPDPQASTPIQQAIHYINEHYTENISLDMLSEQLYISRYHLMREFKQYTTISVHQYLLSKRLILAKSLLQSGIAPTDVATQCGFGDYSCFYKAFRRVIGISPRDFALSVREVAT